MMFTFKVFIFQLKTGSKERKESYLPKQRNQRKTFIYKYDEGIK